MHLKKGGQIVNLGLLRAFILESMPFAALAVAQQTPAKSNIADQR
jgi:hypothetical protein